MDCWSGCFWCAGFLGDSGNCLGDNFEMGKEEDNGCDENSGRWFFGGVQIPWSATCDEEFLRSIRQWRVGVNLRKYLPDSTGIAVKKLQEFCQGEKQFRNEVSTIGTIQRINLIHSCGFCVEGRNRCLVYEFMPKRSRDTHLYHGRTPDLDWGKRYDIALWNCSWISLSVGTASFIVISS